MNKKSKRLLTFLLVVSMVLTQMLFSVPAFAETRHQGSNRYETAAKIATAGWTTSDLAILARGDDSADALAAAPLAAAYDAPILLTETGSLNSFAKDALTSLGVKEVVVVGGPGAVSEETVDAVKDGGMTVRRIYGEDREDTSLEIAKAVVAKNGSYDSVVLANGYTGIADALSISAIAAAQGMPILLVAQNSISAAVKSFIDGKGVYVVGGSSVVSDSVKNALPNAFRLGGANRYDTNLAILDQFAADLDFSKVYLATSEDFADALAGSVIAAKDKAPMVLVGASMNTGLKNFLGGHVDTNTDVVALGGTAAVAASVVTALEDMIKAGFFGIESVTAIDQETFQATFYSAQSTLGTFAVDNDLEVLSAELESDGMTAVIKTTPQTYNTLYTVSYNGKVTARTFWGSKLPSHPGDVSTGDGSSVVKTISVNGGDVNAKRGERKYTVNVSKLANGTAKIKIYLFPTGDVSKEDDGSYSFTDDNNDNRADFTKQEVTADPNFAFISSVNNVSLPDYQNYYEGTIIPSSGTITFTVNDYTENLKVKPVVFVDIDSDGLSLDDDAIPTEAYTVAGVTAWTNLEADPGHDLIVQVGSLVMKDNDLFTNQAFVDVYGGDELTGYNYYDEVGRFYSYDSNDTFKIHGVTVSMAQFESVLSRYDTVLVSYAHTPNGKIGNSTFDILNDYGWEEPVFGRFSDLGDVDVRLDDDDNGAYDNDVYVNLVDGEPQFSNGDTIYTVERASIVGPDGRPGTDDDLTTDDLHWQKVGTNDEITDDEFVDTNVPDGAYVYRVRVIHPVFGTSINSNISDVIYVPYDNQYDERQPLSVEASIKDEGMPGQLDAGDTINILFDEPIKVASNAMISLVDANDGEIANIINGTTGKFVLTESGDYTLLQVKLNQKPTFGGNIDGGVDSVDKVYTLTDPMTILKYTRITDNAGNLALVGTDNPYNADADASLIAADDYAMDAGDITAEAATDGANSVTLTFNEMIDVDYAAVNDKAQYKIYDYDGTNGNNSILPVYRIDVEDELHQVTLYTRSDLTINAGDEIQVQVKDINGNIRMVRVVVE